MLLPLLMNLGMVGAANLRGLGGDDVPIRIEVWEGREAPKKIADTIVEETEKAEESITPAPVPAKVSKPRIDIAALEQTLGKLDAISRRLAEEQIRLANDEDDDFIMLLH